jgi:hypothetical protein
MLLHNHNPTNQPSSRTVQIEGRGEAREKEPKDKWSDDNSTEIQSDKSEDDRFKDDILVLQNYSFVTANEDRYTFGMYRLV